MIKEKISELEKLSKEEKLRLAGELWNDAFDEKDILLSDAQKDELRRRINYAREHPDERKTWKEVREDLRKKYDV
jgi:putative addiction module component (TIGR02574 family)